MEEGFSSAANHHRVSLRLPPASDSKPRLFVKEGPLFVIRRDGPKMHQFFLLTDCLVYGEVIGINRYKHSGTLALKDVEVRSLTFFPLPL